MKPFIETWLNIDNNPIIIWNLSENTTNLIWNWWNNNFIKQTQIAPYLLDLGFFKLNYNWEYYLPNCNFFYWDLEKFIDKYNSKWITWVFWFAPNKLLHLWHLSVILSHIKLKVNKLIFSANDYEASFVRNLDSEEEMNLNCKLTIDLIENIWNFYNINTSFEIRSKNREISKIFNKINEIINIEDIIKIFWENIWEFKIKAMNWQAAAYIHHSLNNDYVIWISWVDELVPMLWVDYIAKKLKITNWGWFFIKEQIPSINNKIKMSKSMKDDNNISHNDEWNIVKNKLDILLKTKNWIHSLKELYYLISNNLNFTEESFLDIFNNFSKKINLFRNI